ncbi:phosphatase PAP2 family protein [Vibrio ostreicida]|uniref:undecaprenyl-diphosphate phosphatase n=1 Tax=Vibrio ostreicida TaxID=526588 RepID=A0ABT8BYA5_9VIBR|nr:phosphatase PAP2 family protein [Vibrio ostreicida]MDN3612152.1 phosphatase PAP2 family protein [Vibrio ostreicida]NPD08550.1 phosphatase PAP2 family protein [Vibrio ostreicida]
MKHYFIEKQYGLGLLGGFFVIIGPLSWQISHLDFLGPVSDIFGATLTLLTYSAGPEGFVITLLILIALTRKLMPNVPNWLSKLVQLGLILVIGFVCKTELKQVTQSPRPYTYLLSHQLLLPNPTHFYKLDSAQQAHVIDEISGRVSPWRTRHWYKETDYSFPSGHTLFAAICLGFFGQLFIRSRCYGLATTLSVWAVGVAYSRLWLGMHRPIDLLGSILFVTLIYLLIPDLQKVREKLFTRGSNAVT